MSDLPQIGDERLGRDVDGELLVECYIPNEGWMRSGRVHRLAQERIKEQDATITKLRALVREAWINHYERIRGEDWPPSDLAWAESDMKSRMDEICGDQSAAKKSLGGEQ